MEIPEFNVSYKPQKISPKFQSTVRHLLHQKIRDSYTHPQFISDVMKPLQIEQLMDQEVVNLSGGELQRVALALCLGKVNFQNRILAVAELAKGKKNILFVTSFSVLWNSLYLIYVVLNLILGNILNNGITNTACLILFCFSNISTWV